MGKISIGKHWLNIRPLGRLKNWRKSMLFGCGLTRSEGLTVSRLQRCTIVSNVANNRVNKKAPIGAFYVKDRGVLARLLELSLIRKRQ